MPRTGSRALLGAAIALLAVLPYVASVRHGFTFDDIPLVAENARIRTWAHPGRMLATDWWDGRRPQSLLWRPLTMATFAVDYPLARLPAPVPVRLPDNSAAPFHLQNLLWHAAASVAFFFLLAAMEGGVAVPVLAAALFAVHPVHGEAVLGIVGRAELVAAFFAFIALRSVVRAARGDDGEGNAIAAGVALLAGLAAKEQAIVVPAIACVWVAYEGREAWRRPAVRRVLVALVVGAAVYLGARAYVLGSWTGTTPPPPGVLDVDNPVASAAGAARVLTPVRVFGEAVRLLVFPRILSADYSYDEIPLATHLDLGTAACLLLLAAAIASAIVLRRRSPAAAFGLAFFLLAWLLTSNLVLPIGTIFGERLLYLPSAGICLAAAVAIAAVGRRLGAPWVAAVLGGALVLAGAGRTVARVPAWSDNRTLFAATVLTAPRSCKAAGGYAAELYARGEMAEARRFAERALAIDPAYPEAHRTLAKAERVLAQGEHDAASRAVLQGQARAHAEAALASGDLESRADAWSIQGGLALDAGDLVRAEDALRKALALEPNDLVATEGLGVVLAARARGETDAGRREALNTAALAQLRSVIDRDPGHAEALQNAAATLRALAQETASPALAADRTRQADAYERRALAASPALTDPSAAANLHGLRGQRLLEEKRFDEALLEFHAAEALTPRAARVHLGIGTTLASKAETVPDPGPLIDQAIASFARAIELEPDNGDAHLDLAIVLLRSHREPKRAAAEIREYLRLVPDSPMRPQLESTLKQLA
ncbi:MAG TPA: hypothetical protein VFV19_17305 [Candidatus Polarisedimenticolaceae bacterium]|nr:hypothetical protein [Candidatus Polarisedimenticolaceae bacterium]